jgi:hypothetical protein
MQVAGILMTTGGVLSLIVGSVVTATAKDRIDVYCDGPQLCAHLDDPARKTAGIAMMIGGGIIATVGIPLWIICGRKVPLRKPDTKGTDKQDTTSPPAPGTTSFQPTSSTEVRPELQLGLTGAKLSFKF